MPDYIYLLENRLSADQRHALQTLRDAARDAEIILFLTGDAVRDLTSGHAVRDIEVTVQGNALKLKKALEKAGAKIWGEHEPSRTLFLCFPGTVRVDLASAHGAQYKKPGEPTFQWGTIHEDLRRRDFTVNAMAISLNEGSFGLLMDPLNGVADIEARALRLVSNYGFYDDPSLLIRATRYKARLGWDLDPRTQTRYDNAKGEDVMQYLSPVARSRELEQIGHEDEGLKVLRALEEEGWMKVLCAQWTSAKADEDRLRALHDLSVELLMQGVHADVSAAQMQLLTAKMSPKDLSGLKKSLLRPGFVEEWNNLDSIAAGFQKALLAKENQTPSTMFKLFMSYDPEAVLWLGFTSKDAGVKERYNRFLHVWPEVKQKMPYALMQEMRIRPELANYNEILHAIFLQLIDEKLTTPEEMKAFLEPYSPPAPPPQVTIKRTRGKRAEKLKEVLDDDEEAEVAVSDDDLDDMGGDEDDIGLGKISLGGDDDSEPDDLEGDEEESESDEEEDEADEDEKPARGKAGRKPGKPAPSAPAPAAKKAEKTPAAPAAAAKPAATGKALAKPAAKAEPAKSAVKAAPHAPPAAAAKHAPAKKVGVAAKAPAKPAPAKHAAAKHAPAKPEKKAVAPVKKAAHKPPSKAHKSVPKAAEKKSVGAKAAARPVAKTTAKPAGKAGQAAKSAAKTKATPKAAGKAKPHKPAKPAPHKASKPGARRG